MVFSRIAFWTPVLSLQNGETAENLMASVSFIFRFLFLISQVSLYIFRVWGGKTTKVKDSSFSVSVLFGSLAPYVAGTFVAQNSKSCFPSCVRLQKTLLVHLSLNSSLLLRFAKNRLHSLWQNWLPFCLISFLCVCDLNTLRFWSLTRSPSLNCIFISIYVYSVINLIIPVECWTSASCALQLESLHSTF